MRCDAATHSDPRKQQNALQKACIRTLQTRQNPAPSVTQLFRGGGQLLPTDPCRSSPPVRPRPSSDDILPLSCHRRRGHRCLSLLNASATVSSLWSAIQSLEHAAVRGGTLFHLGLAGEIVDLAAMTLSACRRGLRSATIADSDTVLEASGNARLPKHVRRG